MVTAHGVGWRGVGRALGRPGGQSRPDEGKAVKKRPSMKRERADFQW
jgi:hypothetical protein